MGFPHKIQAEIPKLVENNERTELDNATRAASPSNSSDNDRPKAQKSPGQDNESNAIPEGQKPGGGKKEPGEYYIYDRR